MTIQDEQKILERICGNIRSVKQETEKYLPKVEDDILCQEMNLFLNSLGAFEKKAQSRMEKKENPAAPLGPLAKGITQQDIVKNSIDCHTQAARDLKYAIHEHKGAGIFATELAKELIDLEEAAAGKLKDYLE